MTKLLQKALAQLAQLPPEEQEAIAKLILDEIESERQWNDLVTSNLDLLTNLADEALTEFKEGKTQPLKF